MIAEMELVGEIPETCIMDEKRVSTKGKVFAYHGGGYDGCIFEWNFFYIDMEGTYHDIHSSGSGGVFDNVHKAEEVIVNYNEEWYTDIYDIHTEEGMSLLNKNESVQNVVCIVFFLWHMNEEYGHKIPAWYTCDICEDKQIELPECDDAHEFLHNFRSCGGIAITASTKICDDCRTLRCCEDCNEIDTRYPEEYPIVYDEEDCVARCVECVEKKKENAT